MKEFACGDVVPGCRATFLAPDDGSILEQVGRHAARDHGITEVGPELVDAVRSGIRPAA
jgi:predicted small metal-binding protein